MCVGGRTVEIVAVAAPIVLMAAGAGHVQAAYIILHRAKHGRMQAMATTSVLTARAVDVVKRRSALATALVQTALTRVSAVVVHL